MSAESERESEASNQARLPFEPTKKRQKQPKAPTTAAAKKPQPQPESGKKAAKRRYSKQEMAIPEVVSTRMVRRVAGFAGVPTALGIGTLVASYLLKVYAEVSLPPIAVLLVNMGFFGLGVLGISYGVLSASWEEEQAGSWLGLPEFKVNLGRMVEGWRQTRQKDV